MHMDETSTPKLIQLTSKQKRVFISKHTWIHSDDPFERSLADLLDKELINPRKQIVDEILEFSKRNM